MTCCKRGQVSWCYLQLQHCWLCIVKSPHELWRVNFRWGHTGCSCFKHQANEVWKKSCSSEFSHIPYLLVSFGGFFFCNSKAELDIILSQSHSFHWHHKTQNFPPHRAVLVGLSTRHSESYAAKTWNNSLYTIKLFPRHITEEIFLFWCISHSNIWIIIWPHRIKNLLQNNLQNWIHSCNWLVNQRYITNKNSQPGGKRLTQVTKESSIMAGRQGYMLALYIPVFKQRSLWWPHTVNHWQPKHNLMTRELTHEK